MISRDEAREIALEFANRDDPYSPDSPEMVILDDSTRELSWGWVFFIDSKLHVETGEFQHAVAGNAPIFVNRESGVATPSGTAEPVEHYIREYEANLSISGAA